MRTVQLIYEQVLLANCMSLIMATCITPINLARTWGSIIFIFVVSTTKEAWDDYNRYIFDKQENDKNVWVVKKEIKT